MNQDRIQDLEKRLRGLRAKDAKADVKPMLIEALSNATDKQERVFILSRLASEWQVEIAKLSFSDEHKAKFERIERAIRECTELEPEEPYHWIRLAEYFHYYVGDLARALDAAEVAIKKAEMEKAFVRQAHGTRIRIALDMKNYSAIAQSLASLVGYTPSGREPDVALEDDFLSKIPAEAVEPEILKRYKVAVQQQRH
jgi:hypothetical protein